VVDDDARNIFALTSVLEIHDTLADADLAVSMNTPATGSQLPGGGGAPGAGSTTASGTTVLCMNDPINILVVDDEPRNLVVLETVLDDPGYRILRAESADQALLALVAKEFALLILDVRMPVMTGFELAHLIRQRKKTEQVPIIFLTAYYNEDQHILEGYGTGAVDYLHKPVNPVILRSKVATFAELHRKSRALEVANRALVAEVTERRETQKRLHELNDTLEQRVAERTAALLASDQQKDNFIATLAHELRNPLAPIRNAVNVMRRTESADSRLTWCRDVIDRQVTQMSRLLEDLLDVSRYARSKLILRWDKVAVGSVIEHAIEIAQPWIDRGGQEFEVRVPPEPILLTADLTRLAQVISNLLINAAKYTGPDGHIQLSAVEAGGEVVVRVKDDGIGIAPEHLARVFEMFTQVPSAKGGSQGGLGIGLCLARGLVEMHGGQLSACSAGLGQGSEFVVRVPLTGAGELHEMAAPQAGMVAAPALEKRRILVVDDSPDSADSLTLMLRSSGHEVYTAYDGEEALLMARQFHPDVALIDLGLPGVDGLEVCRRIRAQAWGAGMLLIAQTGWGQEYDRRRTQAAGFDHHLVKPLDFQLLDAQLRRAGRSGSGN
jgi:signal transduction histidine kinase